MPATKVEIFTADGTWTKPVGAKAVEVIVIGGGGGGQSGSHFNDGTSIIAGSGGGSGGYSRALFGAALLPATVPVVVGPGGAGGPPQTLNDALGNGGVDGSPSKFGSFLFAQGGQAANQDNQGGKGGFGTFNADVIGLNGTGGHFKGGSPFQVATGASGGAGGGWLNTESGPPFTPMPSGEIPLATIVDWNSPLVAGGSVASNGNPGADTTSNLGGTGGSGGGAGDPSVPSSPGKGGNGGKYGGGGAGGGAAVNGTPTGAGGDGHDGVCMVVSYF